MPSDPLSTRELASRSLLLILGWIGCTAALIVIGRSIVHLHATAGFDRQVTDWVVGHRTPPLDTAMRVITWIGSWVAVVVTGSIVVALALTKRLTLAAPVIFAVAWAGEYAGVNIVKHLVGRPRPPRELWLVNAHEASFPSGHAANVTLVGVAITVVVCSLWFRAWARAAATILAGLVIVVVGFSRVELGVHWTTDVLAGCLFAMVWSAVVAWLAPGVVPRTDPVIRPPARRSGG